ncbi:hypothetical protein GCM10028825_05910 [Spirosoma agri]
MIELEHKINDTDRVLVILSNEGSLHPHRVISFRGEIEMYNKVTDYETLLYTIEEAKNQLVKSWLQ